MIEYQNQQQQFHQCRQQEQNQRHRQSSSSPPSQPSAPSRQQTSPTSTPPPSSQLPPQQHPEQSAPPTTTQSSMQPNQHPQQQQNPQQQQQQQQPQPKRPQDNSNEQKRPMNAFLLFCKRQRTSVREQYPTQENRGITKILGDLWSKLDKGEKSNYIDLARQQREAFMKANPNFKWCRTSSATEDNNNNNNQQINNNNNNNNNSSTSTNYISDNRTTTTTESANINFPSLQSHSGDSSMKSSRQQQEAAPKPPKKRFLDRNDSSRTHHHNSNHNNSYKFETVSHKKERIVPFPIASLDQDTIFRVIDEAFSETPSHCRNSHDLGASNSKYPSEATMMNIPTTRGSGNSSNRSFQPASTFSSTPAPSYSNNSDEPVDFSMNRSFNATRQQIINNLVEKML